MNILVIDDIRVLKNRKAVYARTPAEGIALLKSQDWDEVWLDWDAGDPPTADTFASCLPHIFPEKVREVYVHSANPVGAQVAMQTLAFFGPNLHRVMPWEFLTVPR